MTTTVRQALRHATEVLQDATSAPDLEAAVLLCHVLQRPRSWLYAWPESPLDTESVEAYEALIESRRQGHPIAYLVGFREFWSLDLKVTLDTLIPRPETELLVERALELMPAGTSIRVADLGTGSGAIAAALASERPNWIITATDASAAALGVANENFNRLALINIVVRHGDWLAALAGETYDLIVSNPPYIADSDSHLESGDIRHEPTTALTSGALGLDALYHIIDRAPEHLADNGWLIVEHGWDQGPRLRRRMHDRGFTEVRTHIDLEGRERLTEGQYILSGIVPTICPPRW